MKKNLLLLISFFMISTGWSQGKPGNEPAATKLKRNAEITREPETAEMNVSVYPNPSTGIVNLSLSGFNGKKTTVRVVNVIGTVVYQETLPSVDGRFTKTIDMSKFAHGLYYVKLEADEYNEIRKDRTEITLTNYEKSKKANRMVCLFLRVKELKKGEKSN